MSATIFQSLVPGKNWRTGPRAPSNSVGINGDFWLDDSNGDIYEKIAGTYVLVPPLSSGVTSFNGRTGVVVPTAGDYTNTLVGLGNVTDDAQLKRSAGDFASFTSKSVPDAADILLIEDSAASNAKKQITLGTVAAAHWPYLALPSSPDSWNFEARTATDPDLANNGWTVQKLDPPYTVQTRAGAFLGSQLGSDPPGGKYYSSIIDGVLVCQFNSATGFVQISKNTSSAQDYTYKARMWNSYFGSGQTTLLLVSDSPNWNTAGKKFVWSGILDTNLVANVLVGGGATTSFRTSTAITEAQADTIKYQDIHPGSASNGSFFVFDTKINGQAFYISGAFKNGLSGQTFVPTDAGIIVGGPLGNVCHIDFIRRLPFQSVP